MGKNRAKDVVMYAVSCLDIKNTSSLNDVVCPRVWFAGLKPEYKNESRLSFGDYMEAYNLRTEIRPNDVFVT